MNAEPSQQDWPIEVTVGLGGRRETMKIMTTSTLAGQAPSTTALVLIHGGTYTRRYWDFPYRSDVYSFVRWAARSGYDSIAMDKLGVGESDRPQADLVTLHAQAEALHAVIQQVRDTYGQVVLVAHSLGCWTSLLEVSAYHDVDALVLTGCLHELNSDEIQASIESLHEASLDPVLSSSDYDAGYLTTKPGRRVGQWYDASYAEPALLAMDEEMKSVVSTGEVATIADAMTPEVSRSISVPVMILNGDRDVAMSKTPLSQGGEYVRAEPGYYSAAAEVEMFVQPGAGHNTCLQLSAPIHHEVILGWIRSRFPIRRTSTGESLSSGSGG